MLGARSPPPPRRPTRCAAGGLLKDSALIRSCLQHLLTSPTVALTGSKSATKRGATKGRSGVGARSLLGCHRRLWVLRVHRIVGKSHGVMHHMEACLRPRKTAAANTRAFLRQAAVPARGTASLVHCPPALSLRRCHRHDLAQERQLAPPGRNAAPASCAGASAQRALRLWLPTQRRHAYGLPVTNRTPPPALVPMH